ncbi:UNVERIFIED_CONTAM: hypothetical protein GTU68_024951 [Idotea baltica]|nr:hypothetical protein [Idotea baltica]
MKNVVIGFLGTKLDAGKRNTRWNAWRPTVALCQHEDFVVDRLELLIEKSTHELAEHVTADIASVSPETEVRHHLLSVKDPWDVEEIYGAIHDFSIGYDFATDKEDYLINITTGSHVMQICLFLLTESRHLPGKLIQASPPKRKTSDPWGTFRTIDLDLSRYDRLAARFEKQQRDSVSFLKAGIDTRNKKFNALIEEIEHVVLNSDSPVLLTGPTGAGKSRLASRIYELKESRQRVGGEFVEVNCAMLRGDQAMSTLFGHTKGAFTGATKDRPGLLRSADGGMLFLDEIGELGRDEQAMLLRAVEEKKFLPVGADTEVGSDFQLIAGTNRNLRDRVRTGEFREDLLARIDMWTFELPGLADRREDIEPNLEFELEDFAATSGRKIRFNKEAREQFLDFATGSTAVWSANFRDLNAAIHRMATLSPTGRINTNVVDAEIVRLTKSWARSVQAGPLHELLGERISEIDEFDKAQLARVIDVCRNSKSLSAAGRTLFNVSRLAKKQPNDADRLRKYLSRFGLKFTDF